MLTQRTAPRGVTLIELMIGVAITAILLALGVPAFSSWIQNTQNRTAAESVLNGLTLARNEAVKRNTIVRFDLTDSSGLVAWNVGCVNVTAECPATIQSRSSAEGGSNARVGASNAALPSPIPAGYFATALAAGDGVANGVSFTGMGRVPSSNIGDDITRIDITNAVASSARRYVITVGPAGQIRMCDPALVFANNPQGCS